MKDAKDLVEILDFIAGHAKTPREAVFMVASMIDGVAGWTDLTPLDVFGPDSESLTQVDGYAVMLHDMLKVP